MTDEIRFKILSFIKQQPWDIRGIGSNVITEFIFQNVKDIKTSNIYFNDLVDEGWLDKNPYGQSSYSLSNKATLWVHEYKPAPKLPRPLSNWWAKWNTILGVFALLTAIIGIIPIITKFKTNCSKQHNDTEQHKANSSKHSTDTVIRIHK